MGLFDKAKKAAQQAFVQPAPQQGDGMVHVRGAGPIDTAVFGGPSTRSMAADDPIWEPINGISLEDYAGLARDAGARGINNEAGMIALAQERGWDPENTKAALDGWVQRMGQSMAVGQHFRKFLGY
jgi:hypothetical protein